MGTSIGDRCRRLPTPSPPPSAADHVDQETVGDPRPRPLADATPPLTFEQAKPLVPIFTGYEAINADDDGQTL
jgi:hypothetical protein